MEFDVVQRRIMALVVLAAAFLVARTDGQVNLKTYETRYYVLRTDLDRQAVLEAESRITAMAEMYYERTKGFGGKITKKLPFYLFSDFDGYIAAGGAPGSAGVYNGERLMAVAGAETNATTWHIIQHEGFHQFVHRVIGGDIPIWANEGLAEYFGEGLYTGDGYVTGVIPPERLARLKTWIRQNKTKSLAAMMETSHSAWNFELSGVNYDQAWSMVYFLAHAERGRYEQPFNNFLKDVSRGMRSQHAWRKNFGSGTRAFEEKWRSYWLDMSANPTADLYAKATVATITSFYARAVSQRQSFQSFDEFRDAAAAGKLKCHSKDWLPPKLLNEALEKAAATGRWQIRKVGGSYQVVCTMSDGSVLVGTFELQNRRVRPGSVKVTMRSR